MKRLSIVLGLLMITSCYAWQVIHLEQQHIQEIQAQLNEELLGLQKKIDSRLPVSSNASAGVVENRTLSIPRFTYSIFIIGDDLTSKQWLKDHTKELEAAKVLGFVTNIKESQHLQELQALTKTPLLPANVDELMILFKESHYPLAFVEGKLWQ
mgnify:CR=1 FL=1